MANVRIVVAVAVVVLATGCAESAATHEAINTLPVDFPCPILLARPIPVGLRAAYAEQLRAATTREVELVTSDGADARAGVIYLAGEEAFLVATAPGRLGLIDIGDASPLAAADRLFRSVAEVYGAAALGVMLAGEGTAGTSGLIALRHAGGMTLAEIARPGEFPEMVETATAAGACAQIVSAGRAGEAIATLVGRSSHGTTPRLSAAHNAAAGQRQRRVCLLDDSFIMLDVAAVALSAAGFDVATATTVAELEAILTIATPDLIVMDVDMREMSVHQVATAVRNALSKPIPILLWSSFTKAELAEQRWRSPVQGYIPRNKGAKALVVGVISALSRTPDEAPALGGMIDSRK